MPRSTSKTTPYQRDSIYFSPRPGAPKHMFVCLADMIEAHAGPTFSLCDIGCASGDFIQYILTRFRNVDATGIDYSSALVDAARERVPNGRFQVGDANNLLDLRDASFDIITLSGTHSIFDDFRESFGECIRIAAPGGLIVITGLFNDYPVDARIHWRHAGEFDAGWHPGYNLVSKHSVGTYLAAKENVESFGFEPFTLPFDLAPQSDPIRSWTERKPDGARQLVNGIMPLNIQMLSIRLRPNDANQHR